jgi:uncharacterized membrane protein YcaP (DUF421 family)
MEMVVRCLLIFLVLYVMCRILGKKLVSQMTFFDVVAGITLGSISGAFMFTNSVSKSVGVVGLILFATLAFLVDLLSLKSFKARKILNDEPTLVIKNGKVHEEGMAKSRLTVDELLFQLRKKNIFYIDQVDFAFFETDGSVSALKRVGEQTPTKTEMQVNTPSRGVPQTFIIDGKILENSLASVNKDHNWVKTILQSNGISDMKDVFLAQIDGNNNIYIDKRKDQQNL